MAKHTYRIEARNGRLHCYEDGILVNDWEFLKGQNMSEMKLFVNGVGVATRHEIEWVGLTDVEYNNIRNGVEVPQTMVEWSQKYVDPDTGEMTFVALRTNGEKVTTVLDKDCRLIPEKCKAEKYFDEG